MRKERRLVDAEGWEPLPGPLHSSRVVSGALTLGSVTAYFLFSSYYP